MKRDFIPLSIPNLSGNESKYVNECVNTSWISSRGKFVEKFEKSFADYCGTKYALTTSNGTVALHLALEALGVEKGEVIVPNLTFIASANTIIHARAIPKITDCKTNHWNINPDSIEKSITNKTKAILPVHLYGHPCDMDEIKEIANKHNLAILEDCAEAHGARYQGKRLGSIGDIGTYSFYGNKIITTGAGGMITTNSRELYEKAKLLRDHGMSKNKRYWHEIIAYNYDMTNLQAAVGLAQLERIDYFLKKRKEIALKYQDQLRNNKIQFINPEPGKTCVDWLITPLIENRDYLISKLKEKHIESSPFFYTLTSMPPYASNANYPNSKKFSKNGINLPLFIDLEDEEIDYICDNIKEIIN